MGPFSAGKSLGERPARAANCMQYGAYKKSTRRPEKWREQGAYVQGVEENFLSKKRHTERLNNLQSKWFCQLSIKALLQ